MLKVGERHYVNLNQIVSIWDTDEDIFIKDSCGEVYPLLRLEEPAEKVSLWIRWTFSGLLTALTESDVVVINPEMTFIWVKNNPGLQ